MKKYNNLDGLRTFAAISIIVLHIKANLGYEIVTTGVLDYIINHLIVELRHCIQIFLILSGFGMCCGYYEKIKNNKISLNQFYSKRYIKILPFFTLLVVLDLVVGVILDGGIAVGSIYEAFADLTLMFGFYTTSSMSVIGVGWTLGVIFGFYMLFPFFVYLIWTKKRAWVSLAVTVGITFVCSVYFKTYGSLCLSWFCYFVAGGLIYLYKDEIEKLMKNSAVGIAVSMIGFVIAFVIENPLTGAAGSIVFILKTILGASLMISGALCADTKLWSNPISKFVSKISLETYLSHMLVFRFIQKIGLTHVFGTSAASYLVACIVTLAGVVLFATAYYWIENKIKMRFAKKAA